MKKLLIHIYNSIPARLKYSLGKSKLLKPLRNIILRSGGNYREALVTIEREYLGYPVNFKFYASLQVAAKAKKRGIENTLLRNSIELFLNYKGKKDCVLVDIGANFGYLSLVWAGSICKNGKLIAFEPNKRVYDSFLKSVHANNISDRLIVENIALGNKIKEVELFSTNSSSNTVNYTDPDVSEKPQEFIKMMTLDFYFNMNGLHRCDLIKIDVDGIELDILKGAEAVIKKFKPILIVETNQDFEIIRFFWDLDYTVLDMNLKVYDGVNLPPNIFCTPNTY